MGAELALLYMLKHLVIACFCCEKYFQKPSLKRPDGHNGLMIYFL